MYDILKDIRVLDLGRYISAPSCCRILADMGAEVIKVEKPGRGDETRVSGPFSKEGVSLYFPGYNRNKKSVTVDFRSDRGKKLLRGLIENSDVIVENFRAGTMDAMGFGYEEIKKINPRAILVSITGFGQTGPDAMRPAYDQIASYRAGWYEEVGEGKFSCGGGLVSDTMAGLYAVISIMMALWDRERTNCGQYIDLSMLTSTAGALPNNLANYAITGSTEEAMRDAPCEFFQAKDGKWMMLVCGPQPMFLRFREVVDDPIIRDERYLDVKNRIRDNDILCDRMRPWVQERTSEEVDRIFLEAGIPCVKMATLDDVLHDRQLQYRDDIMQLPVKGVGKVPYVKFPAKFSAYQYLEDVSAPELGADNIPVFTSLLGMTPEEAEEYSK